MRRFISLGLTASLLSACASPPPFEPTAPPPATESPSPVAPGTFDATTLAGSTWIVEDLGGIRVSQAQQLKLQFVSATEVAGYGGCNSFTGRASISGAQLKLGPIAATQKACAPQAMAEESMYFGRLNKVTAARVENGRLILSDDSDKALVRLARGE